jgi:hypothetical protein
VNYSLERNGHKKKSSKINNHELMYSYNEGGTLEEVLFTQIFCWHQQRPAALTNNKLPLP